MKFNAFGKNGGEIRYMNRTIKLIRKNINFRYLRVSENFMNTLLKFDGLTK